jgi:hypothetical protein
MTTPKPDLFLITGIPGTGKTYYGAKFATDFGLVHYDLEDQQTLSRFTTFAQLISEMLSLNKSVIVTWGLNPEDPPSVEDLPSVGLSPSGLVGRLRSSYALFKFFIERFVTIGTAGPPLCKPPA